jgi:hypothetical protein
MSLGRPGCPPAPGEEENCLGSGGGRISSASASRRAASGRKGGAASSEITRPRRWPQARPVWASVPTRRKTSGTTFWGTEEDGSLGRSRGG